MMKSLSKNVVISLVMVLLGLAILTSSASALSILPNGTGNLTSLSGNDVANETTLNNVNTVNTVSPTNIVKVNEISTEKDLPQTGENDIYVITVIGLSAIVIGSVAYAKSRKYDI